MFFIFALCLFGTCTVCLMHCLIILLIILFFFELLGFFIGSACIFSGLLAAVFCVGLRRMFRTFMIIFKLTYRWYSNHGYNASQLSSSKNSSPSAGSSLT